MIDFLGFVNIYHSDQNRGWKWGDTKVCLFGKKHIKVRNAQKSLVFLFTICGVLSKMVISNEKVN